MQGVVQQQHVVRALQLECKCMHRECSRQAAAIQILESAADRRRMQERRQEHNFWDVAREALGTIHVLMTTCQGVSMHALSEEGLGMTMSFSSFMPKAVGSFFFLCRVPSRSNKC